MSGSKARFLAQMQAEQAVRWDAGQAELAVGRMETGVNFAKRDEAKRGSAMTSAGSVLAGTGLVAGGVPGAPNPRPVRAWGLRRDIPVEHTSSGPKWARGSVPKNLHLLSTQPRGGILGFRITSHEAYNRATKAKPAHGPYMEGYKSGKLAAEHKVLGGLKTARKASYGLTIGGAAMAYSGHKRTQSVKKRDRGADSAGLAGGGAALAGVGHFAPKGLNRFSRRYEQSAKEHVLSAQRLAPHFGGLKGNTMYPEHSDKDLAASHAADRIKGTKEAHAAGAHRGFATQERHFVEAFDGTGKYVRHARTPGLVLAGVGGIGLLSSQRKQGRNKINKRGVGMDRAARFIEGADPFSMEAHGKAGIAGAVAGTAGLGYLALKPKKKPVAKRDYVERSKPLKTSISEDDAKKIVGRVGLKGPLPKGLTREQKMAHYEARYVSAGGHKAQKWQHRAAAAEDTRVGAVAATGLAAGTWAATHGKVKPVKAVLRRAPNLRHHAEVAGATTAAVGAGAELYGSYARRKRSSYASAPAGVASSALRRMQGYTADTK